MKFSTRSLARAAMVAAMYIALTLAFQAFGFGAVQFRVSEALMLLPVLCADAVPGLFIGCLLANQLAGAVWFDVIFGALATLLAAICVRRLRAKPALAAAMPLLFNGAIVGPMVYLAYVRPAGAPVDWALMLSAVGTVALGEAVVCYTLGLALLHLMRRLPAGLWSD